MTKNGDVRNDIARKVRMLRGYLGLTYADMATTGRVPIDVLRRVASGRTAFGAVRQENALGIARCLGFTAEELITEDEVTLLQKLQARGGGAEAGP